MKQVIIGVVVFVVLIVVYALIKAKPSASGVVPPAPGGTSSKDPNAPTKQ